MRRTLSKVWGRRRLLALVGLGAGVATQAGIGSDRPAEATGPVVGMNGYAGSPDAMANGVQGYAVGVNNAGTFGRNNDLNGVGVYGAAPNGTGVHGESANGTAVGARSATGHAVYASSTSGYGVVGLSANGNGILGQSNASGAYGVHGVAINGHAVWGQTSAATGVVGISSAAGNGVWGQSATGTGVVGYNPAGQAALFVGNVQIQGNLTVTGSYPKSAAVPHPDGSHRRMYCMEGPESMFEDTGSGQLVAGRAQVPLDADFAAVVKTDSYRVFLTPEGDCKGLYVFGKTPAGFEVRELQGGTSAVPFSYRVLAKRKDLNAARMEPVTVRQVTAPVAQPFVPFETTQTGSPNR